MWSFTGVFCFVVVIQRNVLIYLQSWTVYTGPFKARTDYMWPVMGLDSSDVVSHRHGLFCGELQVQTYLCTGQFAGVFLPWQTFFVILHLDHLDFCWGNMSALIYTTVHGARKVDGPFKQALLYVVNIELDSDSLTFIALMPCKCNHMRKCLHRFPLKPIWYSRPHTTCDLDPET